MGVGDGSSHWGGKQLTAPQVAALWVEGGGDPKYAAVMDAFCASESRRRTGAVSPTGCEGLWQICPPPPDAKEPLANARYAVAKFNNGKGAGHWTRYNPTAARIWADYQRNPQKWHRKSQRLLARGRTKNASVWDQLQGPSLTNPFPGAQPDILPNMPSAGDILGLPGELLDFLKSLAVKLADPETWLNLGKILIGLIALAIGLKRTFELATN